MSNTASNHVRKKVLTNSNICSKMIEKDRWLICPGCGKKLIKLLPTTIVQDFPLYCRYCKKEAVINIPSKPESQRPVL